MKAWVGLWFRAFGMVAPLVPTIVLGVNLWTTNRWTARTYSFGSLLEASLLEGGDEILHGVDHILVELDDALVLEVDVQQGEVSLDVVLEAGLLPDLLHHPARLVGEAGQAVGRHVLRVGAGRGAETPGKMKISYF